MTRTDRVRDLLGDRRGSIIIELAMLAPLLLLLAVAAIEYGRAYRTQLDLDRIVRAQLQYAVESLGARSVLDEIAATSLPLPTGDSVTFSATRHCACLGSAASCDTLCGDGTLPDMRIEVAAERRLSPLLFFPAHPGPLMLTARMSMRTR